MPGLSVQNLRHAFPSGRVLDGVSFEVQAGEVFGLLGPNGCGKSTTLRVLAGLLVPDACEILLDGARVAPGGRALRRRMGVVFQAPSVDPRLSARENLELSARLQRVPKSDVARKVSEALDYAQLADRAEELVVNLSGGMKRRLELARALLHEPLLLLMDEPTTGLDELSFQRTWQRIGELRQRRGVSVLLTTHRADEAARCDRVAVLDAGRIVALDTPAALARQVSGDVLTIETKMPDVVAQQIEQHFAITPRVVEGKVVLERERGHELIPRLVEALPSGSIDSLSMHRPTLADVFVKLTGRSLGDTVETVEAS